MGVGLSSPIGNRYKSLVYSEFPTNKTRANRTVAYLGQVYNSQLVTCGHSTLVPKVQHFAKWLGQVGIPRDGAEIYKVGYSSGQPEVL